MSNYSVSEFTSTLQSCFNLGVGVCTFLAVGITSAVLPIAASAQSTGNSQPLGNVTTQQNERSTMYGGNGEDFNVFNLIHRAQMGTPRDIDEVSVEQSQNLTNGADKFKLEQLRRFGNQQQNEN
ncbi:MAG: hypothetical protein U7123_06410, partial [Potamolinea sp.]